MVNPVQLGINPFVAERRAVAIIIGVSVESTLCVDEDGFVCLVAPDHYEGFVNEDWSLEELLAHFVRQSNQGALFIAYPGPDHADDPLTIEAGTPGQAGVRRASATVRVGPGGLWHTDYTQLTMAAQFPDEPPMASYAERLPVEEGTYLVTLIHAPADDPSFHVWVQVADPAAATAPVTEVPWFT